MSDDYDAQQQHQQRLVDQEQQLQTYGAAQRTPAPPPPLSPVAEATATLGHCLQLTEQLVLTLQGRLAPVLRDVKVAPLGWNENGRAGDGPLTQDLTGPAAHLVAINTSLHSLVERLAL